MASSSPTNLINKGLNCNCLMLIFDLVWVIIQNKTYTIYILKIHRAELTQAELTQGRVDSGADLTSGRVDPLPMRSNVIKTSDGPMINYSQKSVGSGLPIATIYCKMMG